MKKIKVLRIVTRLNIGGPAIQAIDLCSRLNNSFFESVLIKGREDESEGTLEDMAKERGIDIITVIRLTRELNPINDIAVFFKIFALIGKHKPDIVHTHMAKAGFLGRTAAFLNRVPLIVHTYHGHVLSGYFGQLKSSFFILLEKIMALMTDVIIAISPSQKKEITERFRICRPDKCRVIKLGFDLERFLNAEANFGKLKKELSFSENDFLIGIVGRMVPVKNYDFFIDIVTDLCNKKKDERLKFVIAGDGPLKEEIKRKIKKNNIEKNVFFLGWRRSMESVYADLDIVCLTSINEGTPVSLIEAMASAKPIVATEVGGVKDIVFNERNGFLIPLGNIKEFSQKLMDLIGDKDMRRRFGDYGRNYAREHYSLHGLLTSISDIYRKELERVGK